MKKIIAIMLSILMLLALTACGEPAEQPNTTTNAVENTTANTADDTTAPEDTTAAQNTDGLETGFVFTFEGVDIIPGEAFDAS